MKNPFIYLFALVMTTLSLTSCSGDDDNNTVPGSGSREIKYEVTGTTSATDMSATYIVNSGGTSADITSLPWTYSFTADDDTYGASFSFSAIDATPGDKVTLNIYRGDTKLKSLEATATSDGIIVASLNATFN